MATMLKIGQLARSTGLTVRALHHYASIGLLAPAGRTNAGYRLYQAAEVERSYTIVALPQLGLGLPEIQAALTSASSSSAVMDQHVRLVEERTWPDAELLPAPAQRPRCGPRRPVVATDAP